MTVKRLRDLPDMDSTYQVPHDARYQGAGHHLRVEQTKAIVRWLAEWKQVYSVADLSCGNGEIAREAMPVGRFENLHLGDYAPGGRWRDLPCQHYTGPIKRTLKEIPVVDLFICTETLEHLDKPGWTLSRIRDVARSLVLSTPVNNWGDDEPQHLWEWDRAGVEGLLFDNGWTVQHYTESDCVFENYYTYGIWGCT